VLQSAVRSLAGRPPIPRAQVFPLGSLWFEDSLLPAPRSPAAYLANHYGPDLRVPPDRRSLEWFAADELEALRDGRAEEAPPAHELDPAILIMLGE
jgi:hypothetical protein